ncbi:DnaB-like helicase C-terminal domain-containing protein [Bacillus cereus]|nr:DnaB-like helicase C-terminal domain-containing protein [Bacillus cereus]
MGKVVSNYIEASNGELKPIETGKVYGAVSHVKGGKTVFSNKIVHRALVEYGQDVLFWTLEAETRLVLANIRACHFNYMYEKLGYEPVTGSNILDDEFPTEEHRELEKVSRKDLIENEKYGYIRAVESKPYVSMLKDKLQLNLEEKDYKLIILDGLSLVLNDDEEKTRKEVIESAYHTILDFVKGKDVAILATSQRPVDKEEYVSLENRLNRPTFIEVDLDKVQF